MRKYIDSLWSYDSISYRILCMLCAIVPLIVFYPILHAMFSFSLYLIIIIALNNFFMKNETVNIFCKMTFQMQLIVIGVMVAITSFPIIALMISQHSSYDIMTLISAISSIASASMIYFIVSPSSSLLSSDTQLIITGIVVVITSLAVIVLIISQIPSLIYYYLVLIVAVMLYQAFYRAFEGCMTLYETLSPYLQPIFSHTIALTNNQQMQVTLNNAKVQQIAVQDPVEFEFKAVHTKGKGKLEKNALQTTLDYLSTLSGTEDLIRSINSKTKLNEENDKLFSSIIEHNSQNNGLQQDQQSLQTIYNSMIAMKPSTIETTLAYLSTQPNTEHLINSIKSVTKLTPDDDTLFSNILNQFNTEDEAPPSHENSILKKSLNTIYMGMREISVTWSPKEVLMLKNKTVSCDAALQVLSTYSSKA